MAAFQDTSATRKIFSLKKRIRAIAGGTGASKTISILIWLIDYCQSTRNQKCDVVSESHPHLADGAILDFKNIMQDAGYWNDKRWNDSKHTYTFETGSTLNFKSFDKFGKAHGPRRNVLFINECNNVPWLIADQLITRTENVVWLDWNPTFEFWFYNELLNNERRKDDLDFITLTYLDNEALSDNFKNEILAHKDNKYWWQVYGLGQLGELEAQIYKGWKILSEMPKFTRLERYGVDFGYTNDPTAIVAIYYTDGGYVVDEIAYRTRMSNKEIADTINNQPKPAMVIADSAEPKSIDEIRSYGVNIQPADKGADSVVAGIQLVQEQQMAVTDRSTHVIHDMRNYMWDSDKRTGKVINEPRHEFSHSMDAIRYAIMSLRPYQPKVVYKASEPIKPYYPGLGI